MAKTFRARVVGAERVVWQGQALWVVTRTPEGEIGIYAGHEPLLAITQPGQVRLMDAEGREHAYTASRGFLSVTPDAVEVVAGGLE